MSTAHEIRMRQQETEFNIPFTGRVYRSQMWTCLYNLNYYEEQNQMKDYKIDLSMYTGKLREVVSAAVQNHAFTLGYKWSIYGETPSYITTPFLVLERSKIYIGSGSSNYPSISAAKFLELKKGPETRTVVINGEDYKLKAGDKAFVEATNINGSLHLHIIVNGIGKFA